MSFGFKIGRDGERWTADRRELRAIELHEISVVSAFPAYEGTVVTARNRPSMAPRLVAARRWMETL